MKARGSASPDPRLKEAGLEDEEFKVIFPDLRLLKLLSKNTVNPSRNRVTYIHAHINNIRTTESRI